MGEIDTGIKVTGHAFVVGKFPTIVIGDGMHPVDVRAEPVHDSTPDGLRRLVDDRSDDRIQGLALDQRHQGAPVALADHSITLPVTEAALAVDDGRALIN